MNWYWVILLIEMDFQVASPFESWDPNWQFRDTQRVQVTINHIESIITKCLHPASRLRAGKQILIIQNNIQ